MSNRWVIPNANHPYITVHGRDYSGVAGVPMSVPSCDVETMLANGWQELVVAQGQVPGTPTNDTAAAGMLGEDLSVTVASSANVPLSTGNVANVVSKFVAGGEYLCQFTCSYHGQSGVTVPNDVLQGVSTVSATVGAAGTFSYDYIGLAITDDPSYVSPSVPVKIPEGGGTIYGVSKSDFSSGTLVAYGSMTILRVR